VLLLVMRVVLAPLLLAACAFAAWRWGAAIGGLLLGLPLISGPVSVVLLVQYGSRFAESAARATLFGLLATGTFCVCYALSSRRSPWWLSLAISYTAYIAVAWGMSLVSLTVATAAGLVLLALAVFGASLGAPEPCGPSPKPGLGALALRMIIASVIVAGVSGGAGLLGAEVSGLLAPLPVLLAFGVAYAHQHQGRDAARGLLRGALAGSAGGVAFFATIGLLLGAVVPGVAYSAALAAALLGGAVAMRLQQAALAERAIERAARRANRSPRIRLLRMRSLHSRLLRPAFTLLLRG